MDSPRAPLQTMAEAARRRRGTRITALVVGGIAIAIYAAFILSGVLRA
ncbi:MULTISPECIES: hypothetical protein [Pseudoxanthomonas]|jgi:hypothetical protein|uniref:Uncharacterized protein n=1 Tax=Pseudoxanthomonas winnipegensis TaxID=2480810 RepID=A0AAW8GFC7_9GAMM|nr:MULTISPECIES: hypothetical protein [Pseudoxanthomonas]MDQ1121195.1 hypothetical protein [Pseudoxanthomonas winnipegensis]MDQ1134429.1 hypothetical protein [Pseudoxanthomonas winnipegensis]MDR6139342.1 hypothetical protein [Pseudoxanthomonas sp. SORGH_AS_0997]WJI17753.1 hypothetical protein MWN52_18260 [Pseudoxanthomonas winnipegensis]